MGVLIAIYIIVSLVNLLMLAINFWKEIRDNPNCGLTVGEGLYYTFLCVFPPLNLIILLYCIKEMEFWKTPINKLFKK